jgi:hypothetical protein
MWLIGDILVGSLGCVRSCDDDGYIGNSGLSMVEDAEGGDCLAAAAAFTTFGSQDKKGARMSLLSDPVIIFVSPHALQTCAASAFNTH